MDGTDIHDLHDQAVAAERVGDIDRANQLFRRAAELAAADSNREVEVHNLWHLASNYENQGKLRSALAVLGRVLSARQDEARPSDIWMSTFIYFEVALIIPASLSSISSALDRVESTFESFHEFSEAERKEIEDVWKKRQPVLRGRIAWRRGEVETAYQHFEQAEDWSRLAALLIESGRVTEGQFYLERWKENAEDWGSAAQAEWLGLLSQVKLHRGELERCLECCDELQKVVGELGGVWQVYAERLQIRPLIALGRLSEAQSALKRQLGDRHSEAGLKRFDVAIHWLDFNLNAARAACRLASFDQWLRPQPTIQLNGFRVNLPRTIRRAQLAYDARGRLAEWLDGQLETGYYGDQVRRRLTLLTALLQLNC
jgi:tetratricopeptide (TPR) repeat protein